MEVNNDEVIACARYGELDDLKLLIEAKSDINHKDANGSNALHMACGNGHLDVVQYLCSQKALWTKNSAGNTPLHWCALNKHVAVAEYLLMTEPYCSLIDVFAPNDAGKSAVAAAFDNGCSDLAVVLLKHKSAVKEGNSKDDEEDFEMDSKEVQEDMNALANLQEHVYELALGKNFSAPVVKIRQIGHKNTTEKKYEPTSSASATQISGSSILLARRILDLPSLFAGKKVLELGAGCGLPGLVAGLYTEASHVLLTDIASLALANLKHNISLNQSTFSSTTTTSSSSLSALPASLVKKKKKKVKSKSDVDNSDSASSSATSSSTSTSTATPTTETTTTETTTTTITSTSSTSTSTTPSISSSSSATISEPSSSTPEPFSDSSSSSSASLSSRVDVQKLDWGDVKSWPGKVDVILCSDLLFSTRKVTDLIACIVGLLKRGGVVLCVSPGDCEGLAEFKAGMKKHKFQLDQVTASQEYYASPLANGPDFQLDKSHKYQFLQFVFPLLKKKSQGSKVVVHTQEPSEQ